MKCLFPIGLLLAMTACAQQADTLNGFAGKISGEEIPYFSPLHEFAPVALLTRVNGNMPISWKSPAYTGDRMKVTYEFILGHSTGTSTGNRHFDCSLNGRQLFTLVTPMHQKGPYSLEGEGPSGSSWHFIHDAYDINGDGFGKFWITVPASLVRQRADFTIRGQNEQSRDWLMIFMYRRGLKTKVQATSLVTRADNRRQLNLFIDNPYRSETPLSVQTIHGTFTASLRPGYNKLQFPAYQPGYAGSDRVRLVVGGKDTLYETVELKPIKKLSFRIIHHSHNDIGYSHLQPEVERIQNDNIRSALRWIAQAPKGETLPAWHIESLWAVENFLSSATRQEEADFAEAVKKGQLVLSANYANILTGLCQPGEQGWALEYGRRLAEKYGFVIRNVMTTDIPGISRSALRAYVDNDISYLSMGPNYVHNLPDRGDRVGGVIREQGDQLFYWKPDANAERKLLVWTAGKGYSYFHGITEAERQATWEKRISDYCDELAAKNYPYELVQLRYTKNADNGPVDTLLTEFVENWNRRYTAPQLRISSLDSLFGEMENRYGNTIPERTGEISPYWEDGAYSTAIEEMEARELAIKTLALEMHAQTRDESEMLRPEIDRLHRSIVMFHEHTWGAWCSVSDPELPFTTEQWRIKKQFLDSAKYYYDLLASRLYFHYRPVMQQMKNAFPVTDFNTDKVHGGLTAIWVKGKNLVPGSAGYRFFEPVYASGINPMRRLRPTGTTTRVLENNADKKVVRVTASLPSLSKYEVTYTLFKKEGRLVARYVMDKKEVKEKESLHISLPFNASGPKLQYGSANNRIDFHADPLPGSNRDFICTEQYVWLETVSWRARLSSPLFALYEIGDITDENKTNGVRNWKREPGDVSRLFLYLLNNYWHTNYKAWQGGKFDFEIELAIGEDKP